MVHRGSGRSIAQLNETKLVKRQDTHIQEEKEQKTSKFVYLRSNELQKTSNMWQAVDVPIPSPAPPSASLLSRTPQHTNTSRHLVRISTGSALRKWEITFSTPPLSAIQPRQNIHIASPTYTRNIRPRAASCSQNKRKGALHSLCQTSGSGGSTPQTNQYT